QADPSHRDANDPSEQRPAEDRLQPPLTSICARQWQPDKGQNLRDTPALGRRAAQNRAIGKGRVREHYMVSQAGERANGKSHAWSSAANEQACSYALSH